MKEDNFKDYQSTCIFLINYSLVNFNGIYLRVGIHLYHLSYLVTRSMSNPFTMIPLDFFDSLAPLCTVTETANSQLFFLLMLRTIDYRLCSTDYPTSSFYKPDRFLNRYFIAVALNLLEF